MQITKAERRNVKIKLAIQGPSGSGKTYSSLLLAKGLTDLNKVCVIDTENGSSNLYAHLGDFHVITLSKYSPEEYIRAIDMAEAAGMEVIIIDSLSHCWHYLLDFHSKLTGNSFANWSRVTPRHQNLIKRILNSTCHVIANLRVKQDYVLVENDKGKLAPQKVGLKSIQRDGVDYEFTIVFELDSKHMASSSKDRTSLFIGKTFEIAPETGEEILSWCNSGITVDEVKTKVNSAESMQDLTDLYKSYQAYYPILKREFEGRKLVLQKLTSNGVHTS